MATKNPASSQGKGMGRTPDYEVHKHYGEGGRTPSTATTDHGVSEGVTGYTTVLKKP